MVLRCTTSEVQRLQAAFSQCLLPSRRDVGHGPKLCAQNSQIALLLPKLAAAAALLAVPDLAKFCISVSQRGGALPESYPSHESCWEKCFQILFFLEKEFCVTSKLEEEAVVSLLLQIIPPKEQDTCYNTWLSVLSSSSGSWFLFIFSGCFFGRFHTVDLFVFFVILYWN